MRRVEDAQVGYPGIRVARPPRVALTGATLKRVALAKLSDITLISAGFGGERIVFSPWLTVVIDHGVGAFFTGVYRTDSASSGDRSEPIWCLRKSTWDRALDMARAREADELSEYLAAGPQLVDRLVFANRSTHPEIDSVMEAVLTTLTGGISVAPVPSRTHPWHQIELDLVDDRLICRIEYSPLIAGSQEVETALPPWLDRLDQLLSRDGPQPDGDVVASIRRSVVELIGPHD